MNTYRCYLKNAHKFVGIETIDAADDLEAIRKALALFEQKRAAYTGFELWLRARRIELPLIG
jgi:hypothetical protein